MDSQIIGLIAAALTTIAFIPQALKVMRTKSTDDLSPGMFIMLFVGILLWLIYGIILNNLPMILANSVTICLASIILFYLFKANSCNKIEHVALWVNNLESMKGFYLENFQASANNIYHNSKKDFSSYFISFTNGARIELMHSPKVIDLKSQWHISISLGSKEHVDKLTEKLRAKGIEIVSETRTTGDGYYESVIKDPEGNLIELTV